MMRKIFALVAIGFALGLASEVSVSATEMTQAAAPALPVVEVVTQPVVDAPQAEVPQVSADGLVATPAVDLRPDILPTTTAIVSISMQQLVVMSKKGDIIAFAPIVTGWKDKWDTTQGIFNVTQKCQNKALVAGHTSVYWLRFHKGEGLHDALWREPEEFGGATYLTDGSHGCVNVPFDTMATVYAAMEVGDVVIVQP